MRVVSWDSSCISKITSFRFAPQSGTAYRGARQQDLDCCRRPFVRTYGTSWRVCESIERFLEPAVEVELARVASDFRVACAGGRRARARRRAIILCAQFPSCDTSRYSCDDQYGDASYESPSLPCPACRLGFTTSIHPARLVTATAAEVLLAHVVAVAVIVPIVVASASATVCERIAAKGRRAAVVALIWWIGLPWNIPRVQISVSSG